MCKFQELPFRLTTFLPKTGEQATDFQLQLHQLKDRREEKQLIRKKDGKEGRKELTENRVSQHRDKTDKSRDG